MVPRNMDNDTIDVLLAMTTANGAAIIKLGDKVDELSRKMSERDGERRFASWLMCTISAMFGSGLGFLLQYVTHKA